MATACLPGEAVSPPPGPRPRPALLQGRGDSWFRGKEPKAAGAKHMELRFGEGGRQWGVPPSPGPTIGDFSRRLVRGAVGCLALLRSFACRAIRSLPLPPHGGRLPPHHPKTKTPLRFPGQGGGTGFRKTELWTLGDLGGDPKGLGVTMERRECLPLLFPLVGGLLA